MIFLKWNVQPVQVFKIAHCASGKQAFWKYLLLCNYFYHDWQVLSKANFHENSFLQSDLKWSHTKYHTFVFHIFFHAKYIISTPKLVAHWQCKNNKTDPGDKRMNLPVSCAPDQRKAWFVFSSHLHPPCGEFCNHSRPGRPHSQGLFSVPFNEHCTQWLMHQLFLPSNLTLDNKLVCSLIFL